MSSTPKTLSQQVADFVASRTWDAIPAAVRERAALIMLDAIGTAFAASRYPFAPVALSTLGSGDNILPDEPASAGAIVEKFMHNTDGILPRARAERVRDTVLGLERVTDGGEFVRTLGK